MNLVHFDYLVFYRNNGQAKEHQISFSPILLYEYSGGEKRGSFASVKESFFLYENNKQNQVSKFCFDKTRSKPHCVCVCVSHCVRVFPIDNNIFVAFCTRYLKTKSLSSWTISAHNRRASFFCVHHHQTPLDCPRSVRYILLLFFLLWFPTDVLFFSGYIFFPIYHSDDTRHCKQPIFYRY